MNVQEFLQEAFLHAIGKLSDAVGDLDSVIGIEVSLKARVLPASEADYIVAQRATSWFHRTPFDLRMGA